MRYDFHGLTVETQSPDAEIAARWGAAFASRPPAAARPDINFGLALAAAVPPAPPGQPQFRQGDLLEYYLAGDEVTAHFPRFGQVRLNLSTGEAAGRMARAALTTQGVFEDVVAIGLSPLLRRRGMFLLHAFAAAPPAPAGEDLRAALLIGDIGAGKTTTGLALLHAGWKLLSNDSPILKAEGEAQVLAYPGLLSAYPDTLARFAELRPLIAEAQSAERRKVLFAAETIYPDTWRDRARAGALLFPQIEARADHALEPLPAPEALRLLLPNAVEQWDREMIPAHLALLGQLAEAAPAYVLRLGPDMESLAAVIASAVTSP